MEALIHVKIRGQFRVLSCTGVEWYNGPFVEYLKTFEKERVQVNAWVPHHLKISTHTGIGAGDVVPFSYFYFISFLHGI